MDTVQRKRHRIEMIDTEIEMLKRIWQDPAQGRIDSGRKDGMVEYTAGLIVERRGLVAEVGDPKTD